MLLPVTLALGSLGLLFYGYKKTQFGVELDAVHDKIYEKVLEEESDPTKILALSNSFKMLGKDKQAEILQKRANIKNLPADVKRARKNVFRATLKSTSPIEVETIALGFENEGWVGTAYELRKYANALKVISNQQ